MAAVNPLHLGPKVWRILLINMRARLIKYEVYSCHLGYYWNV